MNKIELAYFKDLLLQWQNELMRTAGHTIEGLLVSGESMADPLDRATIELGRNSALRIRDRESMLLKKIRQSLEDIENGRYGVCEECGENIAIARLKARPVAKRCIRCKTKQEAYEKVAGY